jgi:5-methylthioribose kinase
MMHSMELSPENAAAWLESQGVDPAGGHFTSLGGGVSNHVILADLPGQRLVIKQSLAQLRVAEEWLSERERIFREAAAMRWLQGRVEGGRVPAVCLEDRTNFAIAIEAAPPTVGMWKARLFAGTLDDSDAHRAGTLLGSFARASHGNAEAAALFGDQTVFDQLRIDPYYRTTAARHPAHAAYIRNLIERSASRRFSLTHGDYSPKNLLTDGHVTWVIDWEVIHYGDPAFDVGFLLNHLFLKSLHFPEHRRDFARLATVFVDAFSAAAPPAGSWIVPAAAEHLPALLLARVDGKSPAEYLDDETKIRARKAALAAMDTPLQHPLELFER